MAKDANKIAARVTENLIYQIRGQRVMLDNDLAALYGVEARILNQAVKRNIERFPDDFMFQLSARESELIRSHVLLPNSSQIVTSSKKHRGAAYRPYAFTEQGIAMLSGVLRSPRAVQVNIEIMRTFVRLRQWLGSNAELTRRLNDLETKYDEQFKAVFEAIRELMSAPAEEQPSEPREIGFHAARPPRNRTKALATSRQS